MSNLTLHRDMNSQAILLPEPRAGAITIRPASGAPESNDLQLIDALQKKNSNGVGFARLGQLINNIAKGEILIAEQEGRFAGYCLSKDHYKEHDDVGIVYQLAVVEGQRRGLIGATLIKEVFNRAAYGCKLFCCWCAQDLDANYFWESLGFVPFAFRTGSRKVRYKDGTRGPRIHIFWQRRIREGDLETPYWFPKETRGGPINEARLVLPIPPGTHWSDAKPSVLPGAMLPGMDQALKALPAAGVQKKPRCEGRNAKKPKAAPVAVRPARRGVWVAPPTPPAPTKEQLAAAKKEKKQKAAAQKFKNDPRLVAAARELRDRYIEEIVAPAPGSRMLPPSANGKYEVSRMLEHAPSCMEAMKIEPPPVIAALPLLEAA